MNLITKQRDCMHFILLQQVIVWVCVGDGMDPECLSYETNGRTE